MVPVLLALAAGVGYILGWCILGPLWRGYKPFTTTREVAEDQVSGLHPDRRTRYWKR